MDIIYLLAEFPSVSEYFILNEISELELRNVKIHILAIKEKKEYLSIKISNIILRLPQLRYYKPYSISNLIAHLFYIFHSPKAYFEIIKKIIFSLFSDSKLALKKMKHLHLGASLAYISRHIKSNHIHAHFASQPASVAAIIAALSSRTYSISAHAHDIYVNDKMLKEKLEKAAFVITCTKYNKSYLDNLFSNVDIYHIYHGIQLSDWPYKLRAIDSHKPIKILSIGRLVKKKGLHYLIGAIAMLKNKIDIECLIVGDGTELEHLISYAAYRNVIQQIKFLQSQPQEALVSLYHSHDIFVLPCIVDDNGDRDGLPNVILEALATGIPVITTGISAISELIINNKNGLIVSPKDEIAIANAIIKLVEDKSLYASIAKEARASLTKNFDICDSTDIIYDIFEKNLGANKRSPLA